jgi:hypothetical protein
MGFGTEPRWRTWVRWLATAIAVIIGYAVIAYVSLYGFAIAMLWFCIHSGQKGCAP